MSELRAFHLPGPEGIAAFAHLPAERPSGHGVLLVPPHGWDDQTSYRPRRDWADALAAAGHVALRIDLPSSGDSAGSVHDPDRLDAWTDAVRAGAGWLLDAGGASRLAVVAMGLGGLLTLRAVAGGCPVDDVVLWGVPAKGRAVTRELKAFGRLEASQTGEDPTRVPAGELRAGGHVMSAATSAAVGTLDVAALVGERTPRRAFVLGRDGVGPDDALVQALRDAGAEVSTDRGRGWGGALSGADTSRAPRDVFAATGAFLAAAPPAATGAPPRPPAPGTGAQVPGDGAPVRETPLLWPGGAGALFGVLAEPADGPVHATALLLNAGALRHIGPNRMWTETARRWAARGVATLRLDLEGIGDSDGDGTPYVDAAAFHTEAMVAQVAAAIEMLAARGLPARFVVAGMCSGAYWAFNAALRDERVQQVVSLNQRQFFWDPDAVSSTELRRFLRIFTPQGFRNMLVGDRRLLRLWRLVRWLAATPLRLLSRRGAPPPPGDRLNDALQLLHDRGQRLDLAFSDDEPLHDWLQEEHRLEHLGRCGVTLHELPLISHTLKPVPAQHAAAAVLDAALERAFPEAGRPHADTGLGRDGHAAEAVR